MGKVTSSTVFDLEYFFEITPDLLCIAGFDGYFKKINPAVSKTLGYTDEALLSAPINSFVHPDDRALTAKKREALTEGQPLLKFENRYVAKNGTVVWLSWTSMPIERDRLVFAIAKDITYKKRLEEYDRVYTILSKVTSEQKKRFKTVDQVAQSGLTKIISEVYDASLGAPSTPDQLWLSRFETFIRAYAGKLDLNISLISAELAVSERQIFRQIDRILGITPNRFIRIIRLHLAWEAIATGKYRTIAEIAAIAGYGSSRHFKKLFYEIYGIDVAELL